ncbi:hypothetical protein OZ691_004531, partial [Yersinia enterocolitica]
TIEDELFKRHAEERRELNVLFTPPSSVVEMSEPVAESPSATVNSTTADTTAKQSGANDADVAVSTGSGGVEQEIGQEAVSETPPGISNEGEVMDWEAYEAWQQSQHQTQTQVRREEVNINRPVRELPGDEEIF